MTLYEKNANDRDNFSEPGLPHLPLPKIRLPWPNPRHVVMFAQTAQVPVQLLDSFLVGLDPFPFKSFVQLGPC